MNEKNIKIKPKKPKSNFNPTWVYGLAIVFLVALVFLDEDTFLGETYKMNEYELFDLIKENEVKEIVIEKGTDRADVFLTEKALNKEKYKEIKKRNKEISGAKIPDATLIVSDAKFFREKVDKLMNESNSTVQITIQPENVFKDVLMNILIWVVPLVLIWMFVFRRMSTMGGGAGGQIFNIGKSKAKIFDENSDVQVSFKNVAGLEGAKEEVEEIVDFLKNPDKFTKLGGKIPKGVLLVGPPGTGKTLLAKAVAGEAKVPFYSLSGSDFVEMFVGVGASRVRDLFKNAKEKAPAIIFIDEIDAIGRARGKNSFSGGNDERENTLNQLLTEMDGFGTDTNVIVMAATNRADVLDSALMRAGRFDRRIYVELPELKERVEIFEVHLKGLKLGPDVKAEFLAKQTPGFSGADIANLCNESALVAARKNKSEIERQDFLDAVDRIVGGLEKKSKIIKPKEKKRIAYHEAGHATASWMLEHAAPLIKVTIVPRGRSLGAAWYLPDERQITTKEQMLDEICATMAGRAAEKVIFGNISTGALSDLEKVTKQAQAMVSIYGLNDEVGNVSYFDSSGQQDMFNKPYSESTAKKIDEQVSLIIENEYKRAIVILTENRDKMSELAGKLLEKEVIFKEDLELIFGKRAYDEDTEIPIESEDKIDIVVENESNSDEK